MVLCRCWWSVLFFCKIFPPADTWRATELSEDEVPRVMEDCEVMEVLLSRLPMS